MLVHAPATFRRLGQRGGAGARPAGAVRLRAAGPRRGTHAARPGARAGHRPARRPGGCGRAAAGHRRRAAAAPARRPQPAGARPCRRCGGAHGRGRLALGARRAGRPGRRRATGVGRLPRLAPACRNGRSRRRRRRPRRHAGRPGRGAHPAGRLLGPQSEQRPGQADYADAAASAFAPRPSAGDPHLVLAEAGTGTGKTLGYVAPASLWAERNHGTVWISTFTQHLQRQIDAELARLHPDPAVRRRRRWWCARAARTTCAC